MSTSQYAVRVVEAEAVTPNIKRLRLEQRDGQPLPPVSAGSHTVVTFQSSGRTVRNAYSLLASSLPGGAYEIAVLRSPESRGGSAFIHEEIHEGHELSISAPVNLFAIHRRARHHVLVAGGIGITPIAAMADELWRSHQSFELHYAIRDEMHGAFCQELARRYGDRVRLYSSERGERLRIREVIRQQRLGTHLYVCGPERMIEAILDDARAEGWPESSLHAERFLAPAGGEPFDVRLAKSELSVRVGEHESLLEALERAGVDAPYLCRGGVCGQCYCTILSKEGELDHRDHFLTSEEKAEGRAIMTCVSRLKGRELELDL